VLHDEAAPENYVDDIIGFGEASWIQGKREELVRASKGDKVTSSLSLSSPFLLANTNVTC